MNTDKNPKYKLQELDFSHEWSIKNNVFYNIALTDNITEKDKFEYLYCQENLLLIQNGQYYLDLGWYGLDSVTIDSTGFCLYLFRGESWLNSELLVKTRTKDKTVIVDKINELMKAVENGDFNNLTGYRVSDEKSTSFEDFDEYESRIGK